MILGATVLFLALPMAFLIIKNDPSEVGKLPDGDDDIAGDLTGTNVPRGPLEVDYWFHAFKSMPLWQLCEGYFVCGVTNTMMATHYVPYAIEEGFSASTAAMAFVVLSALNMIGVLGVGFLGDRVGRKNLLALIYGMQGVGYAVLVTAPGLWGLYGFAIISGFSWLATIPLTISLTSEVYGLRNIGTLSGIMFMAHQIGGAMSVQFAGIMKDVTGEYTIPFAIGGLLLAFASVASFSIREKEYSSRYQALPKVVSA
jgi:MFS family permease